MSEVNGSFVKRILVAVDFSQCSRQALHSALVLSRAFGARLRVVHVTPRFLLSHGPEAPSWAPNRERLEQELDAFVLEQLEGESGRLEAVERKVALGLDAVQILEEAAACDASLIVLGSHGHTAMSRLLLGSVSSEVVKRSSLPVLVVKGSARARPLRILAAVELDSSLEAVLREAEVWKRALGAEIEVVHVHDDRLEPFLFRFEAQSKIILAVETEREEVRKRLAEAMDRVQPPSSYPHPLLLSGRPDAAICQEAESGDFDLVIVGTHERHKVLDIANTTARVLQRSRRPVLIVSPTRQAAAVESVEHEEAAVLT